MHPRLAGPLTVALATLALVLPPPAALQGSGMAPLLGGARPAAAQGGGGSGDQWFVPGGGGAQRPAQQQPQQQRPAQQQQRPAQAPRPPAALPPGQQPPAAVIGIVDVPEIQRDSAAFNQVREEIERRRQRLNDDLQREQAGWRDAQQELANQRASLPPDQLRARERALQDRITDSQRIFRERSRAIEQVAQQALVEIEQGMAMIIRQVAASRNVNLVLPRQVVIFNEPAFDLTAEVTQRFNQALRGVTIPPEGAVPPAPAAAENTTPPPPPAAPRPPAQQGQRRQ